MRVVRGAAVAAVAAAMLAGSACAGGARGGAAGGEAGRVVVDTVHSALLAGNPLGDGPARELRVYLPPGYDRSARRYPVVYLLHGFEGSPEQWTGARFRLAAAMDSLIAAGRVPPLIVAMPDGRNALGGSFFADAAATGRWGGYLADEVVAHLDARYRTLPSAAARGVAGWSMGGRSALEIAAARPDRFGAVYAMSPCCLGAAMLLDVPPGHAAAAELLGADDWAGAAATGFHARLLLAATAAAAPEQSSLRELVPFAQGAGGEIRFRGEVRGALAAADPERLVARRAAALSSLRAVGFDAGEEDAFTHIPATVQALAGSLSAAGIAHRAEIYEGTHGSHVAQRLRDVVLPFLARALAGGP